jgi:threonine dehydratase
MLNPLLREIYAARARIAPWVRRTPLERSAWLSEQAGCAVYLKLECWQPTRSFKARGAHNAVLALAASARAAGLVTASAGNHGQALALAARAVGARATIFVPAGAPATKQARIRLLGAELRPVAGIYDDAYAAARAYAAETGATFVHAFTDPAVVAGQGTIGLEILEDLPDVAEVVVPVGGGGLIAGVGTVLRAAGRSSVRVLGVQSDRTPAMHDAFRVGAPVDSHFGDTLADGMLGMVEEVSYRRAREVTDDLKLVDESLLAPAIRSLYERDGVVAEGSGAVPVAAVEAGLFALRGPVALIISGGNIDGARLASILTDSPQPGSQA